LQKLPFSLSPDAFSPFGGPDNASEHNKESVQATLLLFDMIKQFASKLEGESSLEDELTEIVHREGINVRYLGILRSHLKTNSNIKEVLLNEMVARYNLKFKDLIVSRVLKNKLKDVLRKTMGSLKTLAEDPLRKAVLKFFNLILGWNEAKSRVFWQDVTEDLSNDFPSSLTKEENMKDFELRKEIKMYRLFKRIQQKTGVKLT
jgi:hypothetical protein